MIWSILSQVMAEEEEQVDVAEEVCDNKIILSVTQFTCKCKLFEILGMFLLMRTV